MEWIDMRKSNATRRRC